MYMLPLGPVSNATKHVPPVMAPLHPTVLPAALSTISQVPIHVQPVTLVVMDALVL